MKDYKTFLKLQETVGNKQAKARRQGYEGNANNIPSPNQQANNRAAQGQNQPSQALLGETLSVEHYFEA
jgi:hypothetical protein